MIINRKERVMMETLSNERMKELEDFCAMFFSLYFEGKERYNITDEEFAIIAAGAVGQIALESEIKNGNHKAIEIVFCALRIMISYLKPELIAQTVRERLKKYES